MPTAPTFFARRDGVFAEDIVDEVLIYDTRADMGHALNEVAAVAWRTCEGGATLDEIAEQLIARDLADSSEAAAELADTAVAELIEKRLLDTSGVEASAAVSRRQALRRMAGIGGAAIMGPLVVSAAVPTSASAAGSVHSCKKYGVACNNAGSFYTGNNCCSNTINGSGNAPGGYCGSPSLGQSQVCTNCTPSGSTPAFYCYGSGAAFQCCTNSCGSSGKCA